MQRLKKIIAGHELKIGGERAVSSAAELARRSGAALKVIHVIEPYAYSQRLSHPLTPPYTLAELSNKAREQLSSLTIDKNYGLDHVECSVLIGKPFVELIRAQRDWEADLLVVAGTATGEDYTLGNTAERVARKAMVPTLIAKRPLTGDAKRFLVPVDFSPTARKAAGEALTLAESFGAQVRFFHAVVIPELFATRAGVEKDSAEPEQLAQPEALEDEWQAFLADLPGLHRIRWERHTEKGIAGAMIIREAEKSQADLLIMGTHGMSGLKHMLLGSVAEEVLRHANCPILTLRPEAFQFELP